MPPKTAGSGVREGQEVGRESPVKTKSKFRLGAGTRARIGFSSTGPLASAAVVNAAEAKTRDRGTHASALLG